MSKSKQQKLEQIRHSLSHVLAMAVLKIMPRAKLGIGPPIRDGFYYDFDLPQPLSEADLTRVEEEMRHILKQDVRFQRHIWNHQKAKKYFAGQPYKLELIEERAGQKESVQVYQSGDFVDFCKGGHVVSTAEIPADAFKLTHIAGAYWRGSENNPMLTRIYGVAFAGRDELDKHLEMLQEAEMRDHRRLGRKLDLFTFSKLVGSGLPLWTPKGTLLRDVLNDLVWQLRKKHGYQKVEIPHITKKDLFEVSGHWDKFRDELFKMKTREGDLFALKPMNCPFHAQIYARRQHSYRELPQRYANTTMVYRDEQTGQLGGLSRVRAITQDDGHVFCRRSQVKEEFLKIWDIVDEFYTACGFPELQVRLSLRDPGEQKMYLGSAKLWQETQQQLREIAKEKGRQVQEAPGEAAFYGPKIDFMLQDSLQRSWQVATIQLDFNLPERFGLVCINEKGRRERIAMIHTAIMGSIERFLSILIEHSAGAFPFWLAPVQIRVLSVSDQFLPYARQVSRKLGREEFRVELDDSDNTVAKKIRDGELQRIPYVIVVGKREQHDGSVAVRTRGSKQIEQRSLSDFVKSLKTLTIKKL